MDDESNESPPLPVARTRYRRILTVLCGVGLFSLALWYWYPRGRAATPVYRTEPIVNAIAFSSDRSGRFLAAALSDGRVRLWDAATKEEQLVKLPSQLSLHDLAWNSDGELLTGGFEQHVLSWNVKGARARKLPIFPAQIVSLACRPGRGELIISLSNGQLFLVDSKSNEKAELKPGHVGVVKVVRFHPKGTTFVTGGADGQLVWHDLPTRQVTRKVAAHQHEISSLAFSDSGQKLVSGSWDQTAKVWDNQSDPPLSVLTHPTEVFHVAWMGDEIVTSGWDEQLRVWTADAASATFQTPWSHGSLAFAVRPGKREIIGVDSQGTWHVATP